MYIYMYIYIYTYIYIYIYIFTYPIITIRFYKMQWRRNGVELLAFLKCVNIPLNPFFFTS